MRLSAWSILVLVFVICAGSVQAWTGFSSVVSRLSEFQAPGGGFKGTSGKPTAEATSNALLLASLYGLNGKVNTTEATKFITSLENGDGGYGPTTGSPSDIESTKYALQALEHLGGKATHPAKVTNYIKSLYDSSNNLFAVRSGEKGTVKGTALALQSLEALGELNQGWVKEALPKIKTVLNKHKPSGDVFYFSFPEEKEISQLTANYYGIIAGNYVGFDFGNGAKWAKAITDLQSTTGQFYDTVEKKATSLASTAHAMLSLSALGTLKGAEKFVDAVNVDNLKTGVRHIAHDISAAAHAHSAVALTKAFKDFFTTALNFGGDSDDVLEGSDFTPSLSVHTAFDDKNSNPHGTFDVDTTTTFHGKDAQKGKLTWNEKLQRYAVDKGLATLGMLGPVKFAAKLARKVAGLGNLAFDLDVDKNIGYGLNIVSKASLEGGAEVRPGESVAKDTDFKFTVDLSTFKEPKLLSGDFVVTFTVLDSSNVEIYHEKVEGASNKGPISFSYKLASTTVPAGQLTFRFDVAGKNGFAHTTRSVKYLYNVPLVASNIAFGSVSKGKAAAFKLGDNVKITFEPAAFPDLRNTYHLATKDVNGKDITDARHFFLDIKSLQGALIRSVESAATKGSTKYTFDFTVEPTLDSIGTNVLSFRYVPAVGDEITLQNFDSSLGELFEDTNVLNYTVKASLALADAEIPKAGDLSYGGNVGYKFRLKDEESGQYVYTGEKSLSNVFLDLTHEDGGRTFTSLHHPASVAGSGKDKKFNIDWIVNPNVLNGAGALALSVLDVDGTKLAVKGVTPSKVNIGGDIDVTPHVYTSSIQTSRYSALIAEFTLSCKGKGLKDADLSVNVVRDGAVVATLPVAHNNGRYTVSLTGAHKEIPSANYKFLFFRNADRARAQERRDQRLKRERKERELRGDVEVTSTVDEVAAVKPLFVVEVPYYAPKLTSLPVRAEFLTVILLGGLLAYLQLKKSNLSKYK